MGFVFSTIGLSRGSANALLGTPHKRASRLHIAGSTTMGPVLEEIAAKYRLLHPEVSIDVELGGSARGLGDLRSGHADIAMLSRALAPSERDLYGIPIARDGVGVVVHANNPLRELSLEQLQGIFAGRIRVWREVGGSTAVIHLLGGAQDGTSSELLARFLKLPREAFSFNGTKGSNVERLAAVAGRENAIAYVSIGTAERAISQGVSVRLLPISGIAANSANIRNASYPICRALTLASREAPVGLSRSFFAFCLSAQVNGILSAFDFVPYLD